MKKSIIVIIILSCILLALAGLCCYRAMNEEEPAKKGEVRIPPTPAPTPTPTPTPTPSPTPTPTPTPSPTPTPTPRDVWNEALPGVNDVESYTVTYEETWSRYDTCWEITKDSRGSMSIAYTGYSPFSGLTTDRMELMRFVNGWAYLNVKQTLEYFGEDPASMGITTDGWLRLQQPAEFYTSVLDLKSFFLLYVDTLSDEFGGMDFKDTGDTFVKEVTLAEMYQILRDTETNMDNTWVPPIRSMIKGIKWKDYERKLFSTHEKDILKALSQAGIAEWQGKLLLKGANAFSTSVIVYAYEQYLGDVKSDEDRLMRSTTSGLQIYLGSTGTGTVEIDTKDGCVLDYRMTGASGEKAERRLTFRKFDGSIENPKNLVDISVFGPLLKDVLSSIL